MGDQLVPRNILLNGALGLWICLVASKLLKMCKKFFELKTLKSHFKFWVMNQKEALSLLVTGLTSLKHPPQNYACGWLNYNVNEFAT